MIELTDLTIDPRLTLLEELQLRLAHNRRVVEQYEEIAQSMLDIIDGGFDDTPIAVSTASTTLSGILEYQRGVIDANLNIEYYEAAIALLEQKKEAANE